jgi:lipooligosaccharide transport system permease protein
MTTSDIATRRSRRFEWPAFEGVWNREYTLFRRYWASTTFSSIVQPTIYLLAFGLGVGTMVNVAGSTGSTSTAYIKFVGTGTVATAVLFSSAFPGMFNTYVRRVFQRTYDAVLAAPVAVEELVTAEGSWIALKAGVYGTVPLIVTFFFGLQPRASMVTVPFIAALTGLGFAYFGMWVSAVVKTIDSFTYVTSAVLTPLFLVAGTFFPIQNLPHWLQVLAQFNPLYHCVKLVRDASFHWFPVEDLYHVAFLVVFALITWALALTALRGKLID